jgi:hypothetical protein
VVLHGADGDEDGPRLFFGALRFGGQAEEHFEAFGFPSLHGELLFSVCGIKPAIDK